uniref:DUF3615 domain-containing protein n=1 Tax=Oryza barthii TaxID=65489 RepID=A0A0D3GCF3_9ORYZ
MTSLTCADYFIAHHICHFETNTLIIWGHVDVIRGEELGRLPLIESMIRQDMYWPDGKRKHFNLVGGYEKDNRCLVQALVEKYNDDHNLLGDFAYELKDFLQIGVMYEDQRYYYHINFTTKTKGAHKSGCAMDNLFFAELSHMQGKDEWVPEDEEAMLRSLYKKNVTAFSTKISNSGQPASTSQQSTLLYYLQSVTGCFLQQQPQKTTEKRKEKGREHPDLSEAPNTLKKKTIWIACLSCFNFFSSHIHF